MKKYTIPFFLLLLLISCNSETKHLPDHPAYHNPTVQPYTDSIADHPEVARYYFLRGEALSNLQQDSLALVDVQKAGSLDRQNPQYTFTIGYLQIALAKYQEAIVTLQAALKLAPGNINTRLLLTDAFLNAQLIDSAQAEINKILNVNAHHSGALFRQARIKAAQKDRDGAIDIAKKIIESDPDNYEVHYQLADWYKDAGRTEAIGQYEKTYRLDTNDVAPLFEIGDFYERQKQWKLAKEAYRNCIDKDQDYTDAYIRIGILLLHQDSTEKALRQFNIAIGTDPVNATAYFNKGLCFEKMKQKDSAAAALKQALVFDGNMKAAQEVLGRLR